MSNLKHVGRIASNKRRVVVAYRVVPGEPENCVVVTTEALPADEHDALMKVVESPAGQEANDFALVMARSTVPDGRNMLSHFHATGKMMKMRTDQIEMVPNRNSTIMLNELNELVARQLGVTVADLAVTDGRSTPSRTEAAVEPAAPVVAQSSEPLSDEEIARQLRSQADAMFKEAQRLRKQAEELSPTKKTAKKVEESA